jgi:hypothetical protein
MLNPIFAESNTKNKGSHRAELWSSSTKSKFKKSRTNGKLPRVLRLNANITRPARQMLCGNGMKPECKKSKTNVPEPEQARLRKKDDNPRFTGSRADRLKPSQVKP